jgi:8-oxo-dGTP diphosphatase
MTMHGCETALRYHEPTKAFEPERVTSVLVVAFDDKGRILTVHNVRGVDIPGGHVEAIDRTHEDTARREVMEEAAVTLGPLVLSTVIESTSLGGRPEQLTYMLVMTGYVERIGAFAPNHEIAERHFLTRQQLAERLSGPKDDLLMLVDMAERARQSRSERFSKPPGPGWKF